MEAASMYLIYKLYFSLINNLIIVLFLFRFSENNMHTVFSIKRKIIVFTLASLYSIVPLSRFDLIISNVFFLLTLYYLSDFNLKQSIIILIKFEILLHIASAIICFLHSLLFSDAQLLYDNVIYQDYKSILVEIIAYVVYCLYCNLFKSNTIKNMYLLLFNITILGICLLLSYITLYICYSLPKSYMLSAIFAIIFVLIIICISLYDKFLAVIEENTNYRFKLELNKMEQVYSAQLDDKLNQLHSLRHDMKNHLIVIDGYASQHNDRKIHEYIHNISEDLSLTNTVDSGSHIVSALIAEKEDKAKSQNIRCEINISTPGINIDDFSITTIIGNLFDNAIKAAAECEHGWIRFSITQTGSYMNIVIENSYSGNIIENNGEFTSTKNDKVLPHGIGIKNVRKVVSNLNGQIDFSYASGYFSVKAELPNYS